MVQEQKPVSERRKYARLEACVQVGYEVIGKPGAVEVSSKNISEGGLCLIASSQLLANTPLQLEIKIPDLNAPIRALGRVIWQRPTAGKSENEIETGIEFTGISDFDRFNIKRYIKDRIEA
ncbi:MAG: PilZ domain-containing protein [Candidatus Omnitrophica bacterium]|nr:PilZ domain-containing protein [Candidatus Omnitrophota bacterium]